MSSATSVREYWDSRLDPIDWKRTESETDARRWQDAFACFLSGETRDAVAQLGPLEERRLLELGCGLGAGTAHLAQRGARVTAVDLSPRRAARARALQPEGRPRQNATFCGATVERLPFAEASFDLVFMRDVLMYADPQRVLEESARVLVPGGRLVVVESLAGPAILRAYRRWTSPREYREFTRHLNWSVMERLGPPLRKLSIQPYHLFSLSAFLCLFVFRSTRWYRRMLDLMQPVDAGLFRRFRGLAHIAWRAVAVYEKPAGERCDTLTQRR